MPTTTEKVSCCPHCGRKNDRHTGKAGTRPEEGNVGICFGCANVCIFTGEDCQQRKPTEEELQAVMLDRESLGLKWEGCDNIVRSIEFVKKGIRPTDAARTILESS